MMDTVIVATIYDACGDMLNYEIYKSKVNPLDILENFTNLKSIYNKYIISNKSDNFLQFSDGTKLILEMVELKESPIVYRNQEYTKLE